MILLLISTFFLHQVVGQNPNKSSTLKYQHYISSSINEHPWLVSILDGESFKCAGSIISRRLILTSAHCLSNPAHNLSVQLRSPQPNDKKLTHTIVSIKRHERHGYYRGSIINDIALLRVSPAFQLGTNVDNILLSVENDLLVPDTIVKCAGWKPSNGTKVLDTINLRILKNDKCDVNHTGMKINASEQFCAIWDKGFLCQGDPGGPVEISGVQVGIVPWQYNCLPEPYLSIAHYIDWIKENSKKLILGSKEKTPMEYLLTIGNDYLMPMFWPLT